MAQLGLTHPVLGVARQSGQVGAARALQDARRPGPQDGDDAESGQAQAAVPHSDHRDEGPDDPGADERRAGKGNRPSAGGRQVVNQQCQQEVRGKDAGSGAHRELGPGEENRHREGDCGRAASQEPAQPESHTDCLQQPQLRCRRRGDRQDELVVAQDEDKHREVDGAAVTLQPSLGPWCRNLPRAR